MSEGLVDGSLCCFSYRLEVYGGTLDLLFLLSACLRKSERVESLRRPFLFLLVLKL